MDATRAVARHDDAALAQFASDVREFLGRTPRQLPSRYFYDPLGSALFDAICHLPWYRVTRTELALLDRHAREILEPLSRPLTLAELGCGSGEKLAVFGRDSRLSQVITNLIDNARSFSPPGGQVSVSISRLQ